MSTAAQIRPMTPADLDGVARMAGALVRYHHALDPARFLLVDAVEEGYRWWFEKQLTDPAAVLLFAELDGVPCGYAYARLEPRDWNALLEACAALHDIYVADDARGRGVASALLDAVKGAVRAKGAPRLVLHTATQNEAAQRLFARHGFRTTMLELTAELG